MSWLRIVPIGLALLWSFTSVPIRGAQVPGAAHEHHGQPQPESAQPKGGSRLMEAQPQIGDVTLVDSDGRPVALREVVTADVPVLVNFIFTSCTSICPVMAAGFAQLDRRLQSEHRDVRLVSISIDPEFDTPSRLREYAARVGAGAQWRFLTGTQAAIEAAQRAFGTYRGNKDNHAPATFLRRMIGAPWERLDGLSSGETLMRAYLGGPESGRH